MSRDGGEDEPPTPSSTRARRSTPRSASARSTPRATA